MAVGYTTTGFYRYDTNGLSITTGARERASFNEDGSRLVKNSLDSLDSFYITSGSTSGSSTYTLSSVSSMNYDRVIHFYNIFNSVISIGTGVAIISILVGSDQIYSKSISELYPYMYDCNYNFILPAGKSLTINCNKLGFSWSSCSGVQFFVKSFRFGLNGFDD